MFSPAVAFLGQWVRFARALVGESVIISSQSSPYQVPSNHQFAESANPERYAVKSQDMTSFALLVLSNRVHRGGVPHDFERFHDGTHPLVADHAGNRHVVAGDCDDTPFLGRLDQGREVILSLTDAYGRFHSNTCIIYAKLVNGLYHAEDLH